MKAEDYYQTLKELQAFRKQNGIDLQAPEDAVNHPLHYTSGKIETIDFIEDQALNFHRGNAVKYIVRAGKKDPEKEIEDLKKAAWYINREIARLENAK